MQLIVILMTILIISQYGYLLADQTLAIHSMNYGDSNDIDIWEGLILYQTDLGDDTQWELQYGLDTVTSASFNVVSSASTVSAGTTYSETQIQDHDEDDDEDDDHSEGSSEENSRSSKNRHSGSISLTYNYTPDIQGTTSLQGSYKSDYFSYTVGQNIVMPFLDHLTTIGGGVFYTHNDNSPSSSTTNAYLLPPQGVDLDSDQYTAILSLERILSRTSKLKILTEVFLNEGYLSTGYQRVPIDTGTPTGEALEVVPDQRKGAAISMILSQWLFDNASVHLRGRYYQDSYGITAMSGDINYIQYLNDDFIVELRYRYYEQDAASFYADSFSSIPSGYFSNHSALSKFNAQQIGFALSYDFGDVGTVKLSGDYYVTNTEFSFSTYSIGYEISF